MHEIVKWLAGLEEKACGLYNEAACLFYGDRPLERFFADLAVDELTEMTGIDAERAKLLITTARAHWFE